MQLCKASVLPADVGEGRERERASVINTLSPLQLLMIHTLTPPSGSIQAFTVGSGTIIE